MLRSSRQPTVRPAPETNADSIPTVCLRLTDVAVSFGKNPVLDGVSFDVMKGDLVALLGPSGGGKTTLLNVIGGFRVPDRGAVEIDGLDVTSVPPYRRDIGITFQGYALFPHLTVFENVAFGLRQRRVAREAMKARVEQALDMMDLGGLSRRYPRNLSGGEQQRVAVTRALVIEPRLMLLDEPLANLDANLRHRVRFEIRDVLRRARVTSVFVTHDQDEAFALCDRVAVLQRGTIQQLGTPIEIVSAPANAGVAAFIGHPNVFTGHVRGPGEIEGSVMVEVNGHPVAASGSGLRQGDRVEVFVRPEDVTVVPAAESPPSGFSVRDSVFLGGAREIWIDGPLRVRCRVAADDMRFTPGTGVHVHWKPAAAHAFALENHAAN